MGHLSLASLQNKVRQSYERVVVTLLVFLIVDLIGFVRSVSEFETPLSQFISSANTSYLPGRSPMISTYSKQGGWMLVIYSEKTARNKKEHSCFSYSIFKPSTTEVIHKNRLQKYKFHQNDIRSTKAFQALKPQLLYYL